MIEKGALRPSIETTMHALMSHKIVLHTHPVDLLAWLVLINGKDELEKLLQGENFTWVDYARPGLELTHAIRDAIEGKLVDVFEKDSLWVSQWVPVGLVWYPHRGGATQRSSQN